MPEIRIFNRCIGLTRLTKFKHKPLQGFLHGGQETAWPWWQFRVGRIELAVSRIRPRKQAAATAKRSGS